MVIFSDVSEELSAAIFMVTGSGYVDTEVVSKRELCRSYGILGRNPASQRNGNGKIIAREVKTFRYSH